MFWRRFSWFGIAAITIIFCGCQSAPANQGFQFVADERQMEQEILRAVNGKSLDETRIVMEQNGFMCKFVDTADPNGKIQRQVVCDVTRTTRWPVVGEWQAFLDETDGRVQSVKVVFVGLTGP